MLSAYREGRLAHAWLIGGREGIGKATLAWRFARFVLANPDPAAKAVEEARNLHVEPTHQAARLLAGLAHPDFSLIRREWQGASKKLASEISIDAVRQGLQVFQLSAAFGGWRIAIVNSAEDLNRSSANALLKMVEEPPQRSLILIISHRPGQVLPTIRSRCRRLRLEPLSEDEIVRAAIGLGSPWSEASREAIAVAAKRANGSVREALVRLSPESEGVGALVNSIVAGLPRPDPRAVANSPMRSAGARETRLSRPSIANSTTGWSPMRGTSSPAPSGWRRLAVFGTGFETPSVRRKSSISTASCIFWRCSPRSRPPRRDGEGNESSSTSILGSAQPKGRPLQARHAPQSSVLQIPGLPAGPVGRKMGTRIERGCPVRSG